MTNKQVMLGKKVLLVAEDLEFANSLERIFNFAGVDILICSTPEKAIPLIKSQLPDLLMVETSTISKAEDIVSIAFFKEVQKPPILLISDCKESVSGIESQNHLMKTNLELVTVIEKIEAIFSQENNVRDRGVIDINEDTELPIDSHSNSVKVLLVEDDPLLRNLLSIRFTKGNIPFQLCHDGNEVLNTALEYKPTIIILDIMLPGKNGLDVLAELRQIQALATTPVIVFSNKDSDEDRQKAKTLNVDAFLIKAMTDLNDLIKLILEKSK